jgi:hypothetical protein
LKTDIPDLINSVEQFAPGYLGMRSMTNQVSVAIKTRHHRLIGGILCVDMPRGTALGNQHPRCQTFEMVLADH